MEIPSRCSPSDHLVIIGNGMASHRLIEAVVKLPTRPQHITVIGAEPTPAYNRILLSPLLAGRISPNSYRSSMPWPCMCAATSVTSRVPFFTRAEAKSGAIRAENGPIAYSKRTRRSFAGSRMRVCMVASMPMGVVREAARTSPGKRREKRTPLASRQGSGGVEETVAGLETAVSSSPLAGGGAR